MLANVGMTRIDPVDYKGTQVIPIEFLKCLLPDPASLAENYTGKTSIGCIFEGIKDGKPKRRIIYNICDHAETYKEVRAQAVSYTTGVPPVVGAMMMFNGAVEGRRRVQHGAAPPRSVPGGARQARPALARARSEKSDQGDLFAVKT